jgi:two-component system, LytTR family, response regulator
MKILIIDDEAQQRSLTKNLLLTYFPDITIIGEADSLKKGIEAVRQYTPDLLLLDIDLGDGTGFDLLQHIKPINCQVIFITAYNDQAVRAFKFSALDYLLKPLDPEELVTAIQKAQQHYSANQQQTQLELLFEQIQQNGALKKLILKDSDNIYIVEIANIIRLEAEKNYTTFFLADTQQLVISKTMKEYEDILENKGFFRCHQSHLINLNYLSRIDKRDGGMLVMKDQSIIPLATRRKEALMQLLSKI